VARHIVAQLLDRIRRLRTDRGLTQEAFAEKAQISYKYYQAIEAGRKVDLRLSTLERLAKAHGLEVWELLLPATARHGVAESPATYGKSSTTRKTASRRAAM
jgi:transcriptional regulator with XRE-family HTH domain